MQSKSAIPMQINAQSIERKARRIYCEQGKKPALDYLNHFINELPLQLNAPYYPVLLRLKVVRRMIQLDTLMAQSPTQKIKQIY